MIATSLRGFYEDNMKSVVQDVKNKEVSDFWIRMIFTRGIINKYHDKFGRKSMIKYFYSIHLTSTGSSDLLSLDFTFCSESYQ